MASPEFPNYDKKQYNTAIGKVILTVSQMQDVITRAIKITNEEIGYDDNRYPYLADGFILAIKNCNKRLAPNSDANTDTVSFGMLTTHTTTDMMEMHGSIRGTIPLTSNPQKEEAAFWNDEAIGLLRAALFHALPKPDAEK